MLTTSMIRCMKLSEWVTVHKPIEGIEKSVLAEYGLHYIAASEVTSNILISMMNRGRGFENIIHKMQQTLESRG